uniref:Citrate synthase n=1 Tax=Chromera velia CCMP2878 TaxID=1169474 RepID=A0A0G4F2Z5_9ALVE|eukprot:Cvel_2669.t1-p1 / transcript=Cvel_2669.t1 / gene=Cvel_2669 / organism=Chromera_velia_CCMP2878 / gene_product=Citrate synthase, chromosomal, putative / transcript_product=Citrate synthase, chromosomal, putative / location=Cvel_scaffold106:96069-99021(-) / protein_length=487 / sequence_SO=supercontig / SO=protein_coding / is_pseudo=false
MTKLADLCPETVKISATGKDGKTVEIDLPVLYPTCGPPAIDIKSLYTQTGMFTHDPGFTSTSSCSSDITFIDGPAGILMHRGYRIEDLAKHGTYLEVVYLLLNGELPTETEYTSFEREVVHKMLVHERLRSFVLGFPDNAHPMAVMVGVVGALSAFYHNQSAPPTQQSESDHATAAIRVVAKLPTIAAMSYKHSKGQPFVYPKASLGFTANFLHMLYSTPMEDFEIPEAFIKTMDTLLILHADHEQNASTSTVRVAGSSDANPMACIAAGIASLWGPAHGGANEAVIAMLRQIGTEENIPKFLARAKDKSDPFRLMGFGHRVYKNYDPRAKEMRKLVDACIDETRRAATKSVKEADRKEADEIVRLLHLATELEKQAMADDYFVSRRLFPNVDFYSGIALTAMRIPTSMFTVIFALGRCVGWITQWRESIEDKTAERKIARPRQVYTGPAEKKYVPISEREAGSLNRSVSRAFTASALDNTVSGYFF